MKTGFLEYHLVSYIPTKFSELICKSCIRDLYVDYYYLRQGSSTTRLEDYP